MLIDVLLEMAINQALDHCLLELMADQSNINNRSA